MKFKVKTPLSDIPSRAIRQAVNDARVVRNHPCYELNMRIWHRYSRNYNICSVCLSGSTIARRTNTSYKQRRVPDDFPKDVAVKVLGLDFFRVGDIYGGLDCFGIPPIVARRWKARDHLELPGNDEMEILFSQLLELASDLAKAGL